jgi:hypothetical protein
MILLASFSAYVLGGLADFKHLRFADYVLLFFFALILEEIIRKLWKLSKKNKIKK